MPQATSGSRPRQANLPQTATGDSPKNAALRATVTTPGKHRPGLERSVSLGARRVYPQVRAGAASLNDEPIRTSSLPQDANSSEDSWCAADLAGNEHALLVILHAGAGSGPGRTKTTRRNPSKCPRSDHDPFKRADSNSARHSAQVLSGSDRKHHDCHPHPAPKQPLNRSFPPAAAHSRCSAYAIPVPGNILVHASAPMPEVPTPFPRGRCELHSPSCARHARR
jgi:hypothetical protein